MRFRMRAARAPRAPATVPLALLVVPVVAVVAVVAASGPQDAGAARDTPAAQDTAAPRETPPLGETPPLQGTPPLQETPPAQGTPSSPDGGGSPGLHVTAAGDYGGNENTDAVLAAIAAQAPDVHLALGDLSYGHPGREQRWCDRVTRHLGPEFPFQLLAGNHESNGTDGSIDAFAACLPNRLPNLVGTYAREWYADLPAEDPLVRLVMISPDLTYPDGTWDYSAGTPRYDWTAAAIEDAAAAGIPWVVVGAHKPCLSVGVYECDVGPDLMHLLLDEGVDLVLFGHEHHYARTHQLALGAGCTALPVGRFDADCVRDADGDVQQEAGTVFVTVGTGGIGLRDLARDDPERGYFAAVSAADRDPAHGILDVHVTTGELRARFVPAGGGTFTDAFTIRR